MANTYLYRTPSSAGNRGIWTVSWWSKKSNPTKRTVVFGTPGSDNNSTSSFIYHQDSGVRWGMQTFNVFTTTSTFLMRDPSSWYHLVLSIDTSQGSSDNRTKLYINGERFTDWDGNNLNSITNGFQYGWNNTILHTICKDPAASGSDYFSGNITHFVNIDGQALTPTSFGETDSTTGEWKPKEDLSGLTFGTNGCWLKFENAANLGLDSSGNGNNWTVSGAGTNPQSTDTASNNFCTMSDIDKGSDAGSLTLGGLKITNGTSGSASNQKVRGTLAVSSGKWYFEMKQLANTTSIGLLATEEEQSTTTANGMFVEYLVQGEMRYWNGSSRVTKTTGIDSYTANDIVGCALDMDNRRAYFSKNGVWQGDPTPDPASSPSGAGQMAPILSGYTMSPCFYDDTTSSAGQAAMNFGNPPFTIASGNADANGFGNFEYAVPSGYYALCTKNINSYG